MSKVFEKYTQTIRELLFIYDADVAPAFVDENIEEIWQSHDNWDGGIDTYLIKLNLPLNVYCKLKDSNRIREVKEKILAWYIEMLQGEFSLCVGEVAIAPRNEAQIDFGKSKDDSMWKPGYFRLFISHVSKYKESASNLKQSLAAYGIDCFVAHEDIKPTKEWEIEIENGLFTMDALCAILAPGFLGSDWCDQEVGIALGQRKLVISIIKGEKPHGFIGKYQALKTKGYSSVMAEEVWCAIINNNLTKELYSEKLIDLFLN
ncbi:MAG: toll/interleukin-1 receptor domain-containing protein, partial [Bacteroidia bacterium]|nr:toll/interleukin-1 receptor domain-containing protein [Bacteroidia bacterium]